MSDYNFFDVKESADSEPEVVVKEEVKPKPKPIPTLKVEKPKKLKEQKQVEKKTTPTRKTTVSDKFLKDMNNKMDEILNLAIIGKQHILNEENVLLFFKKVPNLKLYELKRQFHENTAFEINTIIESLLKRKILKKEKKNGWISLNKLEKAT